MKRISLLMISLMFYVAVHAQKAPTDSMTKAIKNNMHTVQLAVEDYASRNNGLYPKKVTDFWTTFPNIKNPVDSKLAVVVDNFSDKPGQVIFKKLETGYEVTGNDAKGDLMSIRLVGNENVSKRKTNLEHSGKYTRAQQRKTTENPDEVQRWLNEEREKARKRLPEIIGRAEDGITDHTLYSPDHEDMTIMYMCRANDRRAVPVLCKIIETYDVVEARIDAIHALHVINDRKAEPTLIKALNDINLFVRWNASLLLIEWGQINPQVLVVLKKIACPDDSTSWTRDIRKAIESKYGVDPKREQLINDNIKYIKNHAAINALVVLNKTATVEAFSIIKYTADNSKDEEIKKMAEDFLVKK
ncbi:HEAT repeat domain-containing protein [candidate division TA06 bacterium]|nr:HEAT repeat domain-containing protein [candidate division TA06 bacterium]